MLLRSMATLNHLGAPAECSIFPANDARFTQKRATKCSFVFMVRRQAVFVNGITSDFSRGVPQGSTVDPFCLSRL